MSTKIKTGLHQILNHIEPDPIKVLNDASSIRYVLPAASRTKEKSRKRCTYINPNPDKKLI